MHPGGGVEPRRQRSREPEARLLQPALAPKTPLECAPSSERDGHSMTQLWRPGISSDTVNGLRGQDPFGPEQRRPTRTVKRQKEKQDALAGKAS